MTLVMAYVILISAVCGAGAVLLEAVAVRRGAGTRWVWIVAMVCVIAATVFGMVAPRPAESEISSRELVTSSLMTLSSTITPLPTSVRSPSAAETAIRLTDSVLPVVWLLSTIVLLVALAIGQRRFRLERTKAREANIGGHDVLLTEHLGPAVAGIRRPVVFVPRWVLALDVTSQQLLLTHELEHVKQRDTSLLLFGAVTAAITPWNPVVWWMVRRLRLAVEQDCDARVLATHPGVRRYADLLLTAASRHGLASRLLAAHFGEYTSDLVRRIEAMTSRTNTPWRRIAAASLLATALGAAACETPRPDPVAPLLPRTPLASAQELPASSMRSAEFNKQRARCTPKGGVGCQIAVIVRSSEGKELARYAGEIPVAHVPEAGVAKINVEEGACGENSCSLIWITLKPGVSLKGIPLVLDKVVAATEGQFVELALPRNTPNDESLVRSAETLRFDEARDTLYATAELQKGGMVSARFVEHDGEKHGEGTGAVSWPARVMVRGNGNTPTETPNVLVSSADGKELMRILAHDFRAGGRNPLDEISADDIAAIDVYKGRSQACEGIGCPLLKIWIKSGREAAYRKR
jgi:beta-lactamase regulating signal transducer with metallopeptidase domain